MRTTKERLSQLDAGERRNAESIRAYVNGEAWRSGQTDDRAKMLAHYEARLAELMAKGAHRTHPYITDQYEADIIALSKHTGGEIDND